MDKGKKRKIEELHIPELMEKGASFSCHIYYSIQCTGSRVLAAVTEKNASSIAFLSCLNMLKDINEETYI